MNGKSLDKKSFPKLIAPYERLHGPEAGGWLRPDGFEFADIEADERISLQQSA
jgi:hypothetical protein